MANGAAPVADAPEAAPAPEPPRPAAAPAPDRVPAPERAPAPAPERPRGTLPAPPAPARHNGPPIPGLPDSFSLTLGPAVVEVPLAGAHAAHGGGVTLNLADRNLSIPGVQFTSLHLDFSTSHGITGGKIAGRIEAPFVHGDAELTIDSAGNLSGGAHATLEVEVLGRPRVTFTYQNRIWSGTVPIEARNLRLPIPNVVVDTATATISFSGNELSGVLTATLHHAALGNGTVSVNLSNQGVTGSGGFTLTMPLLAGSHGELTIGQDDVSGTLALAATAIRPPVPGLTISTVTGNLALAHRHVSGSFGLTATYAGLATLTLPNASFDNYGFAGANGKIDLLVPALQGSSSTFSIDRAGHVHGTLVVQGAKLPIPGVGNPRFTVTLREDGGVDVGGSGTFQIGSLGGGDFTATYVNGVVGLGVDVNLRIPYLHPVQGRLDYVDGDLSGTLTTGATVGPLSGDVTLRYVNRQLSGDGRLAYSQGRFNGFVNIHVDPQGHLSGDGSATFRLADWLTATIGLVVHPDLNVDAHGELVFPAEIVLFQPWKFEQSFFHFEQHFPLWGITIPVVGDIGLVATLHADAGFRASFGPGTIRNIRATGDVSTRPDQEPQFTLSADFNVPAGAEIVLTVGGGIALGALIAEIEGGIDLHGIAGIYGAITLTPTFAYQEGHYMLKGDALLAAAAQLRAGIDAYARVVAGVWPIKGEVWRHDWKLAEWIFDTGWNVGLKAGIEYTLGQSFAPKLSFDEVSVDPTSIVKAAIPESGDPVPAPAKQPTPNVAFTPAAGDPGQVSAAPAPPGAPTPSGAPAPATGGGAPRPPASATPPPGTAPAPAPAAAAQAGGPPPAAGAAPLGGETPVQLDPPDAETEQPEERSIDETYLVYVYDSIQDLLPRKKEPAAPADDELRKQAHARLAKGEAPLPPPLAGEKPKLSDGAKPKAAAEKEEKAEKREPPKVPPGAKRTPTPDAPEPKPPSERERAPIPLPPDGKSPGKPLAPETRTRMESVFDADLSHVRVHTDEAAHEGAKKLGAQAYTSGKDVYFGHSRDPEAGHDELLAHELTHVLQQEGDRTGALGKPAGEAEHEAEHAAKKVREGEKPHPIRKRRDGAVHRAEKKSDGPQRVDAAAHKTFRQAEWEEIRTKALTENNTVLLQRLAQLKKLEAVTAGAKEQVWDAKTKEWVPRKFVPMPFPSAEFLPHRSVTGSTQIVLGDFLVREGGTREDDNAQSQLAALIKNLPPQLGEFPMSPRGEPPSKEEAWKGYTGRKDWVNVLGQRHSEPDVTDEQETSASQWNMTLNRDGFNKMWDQKHFVYYATSEIWRRPPEAIRAKASDDDDVDAATMAMLVSDYQAHHVIPLWLRSASGRPDGDQLTNLAPWHKDDHQVNHAVHHTTVPELVTAATKVTDYREFNPKTKFLVSEWEPGKVGLAGVGMPPQVRLDGTTWKRSKGKAIWLGD